MPRHETASDPEATAPDVRDCAWYQVVGEITELRHESAYAWADATLAGIQETIERTKRVTEGQRRAVANIKAREWAPGRAYDAYGYGRRWR